MKFKVFLFALAFLLAVGVLFGSHGKTHNDRYISFSEGDDRNDGASPNRPWKTLAKLSAQTFAPGAVIHMKRGDVWNEVFFPKGSGDFGSKKWITVKAYGPENDAKPTIDRTDASGTDADWAIKLVDNQAWRFEDIVIRNSKTGLVYFGTKESDKKNGLEISNCEFYDIRGLPDHAKTPEEDKRAYWWMRGSSAISITGPGYCKDGLPATNENCLGDKGNYVGSYGAGLSDVVIDQVKIKNATYGIWIAGGGFTASAGRYRISRPHIVKAGIGAIDVLFVEGGSIEDTHIEYAGGDNCWSGTFGIDLNYCKDFTLRGGEIFRTLGEVFGEGDGEAINLNGPNKNIKITGMKLHHNDAMAIAIEGHDLPEIATYEFSDNQIWENGLKNDNPAPGQYEYPEFLMVVYSKKIALTIKNNLLKTRRGRHLMCVITDGVSPDIWKDDFSVKGETRFDANTLFCGNRNGSPDEPNPPFYAGNGPCP